MWCQIRRDVLEAEFEGRNCVGDGHFTWASKNLKKVHFYAPQAEPSSRSKKVLTQQQKRDNANLRNVRNDVETPFGWIDRSFELSKVPWREGKNER